MATINEDRNGKIKVQIVKIESQADLLVYVTKNKSEARNSDEIWFFDSHGETSIKFVENSPDLKVYYVNSKSRAKWRKPHKLQKRIG